MAEQKINLKKINKFGSREYKKIECAKALFVGFEIMNNEDYRNQLIHRALSEATYWKERHAELIELNPIFNSIEIEKKKWQSKK